MSVRTENLRKKKLTCLRCGRLFQTDRCHRVCRRCTADTREPFEKPMLCAEGLAKMGEYRLAEELEIDEGCTDTFDEGSSEEV